MAEAPGANVLVAVRMRPLNSREKELGDDIVVKIDKDEVGKVEMLRSSAVEESEYRNFKFDFSYDKDCKQVDVYNDVGQPLLDKAFDGFNGTIFAYGQTGSGKTWSMTGETKDPDLKGIIPRICENLFERVRRETKEGKKKFMIICSYFELYNEMLRDLLDPARGVKQKGPGPQKINQLQIKESKALGVYVKGLHEVVVEDEGKIMELMQQGNSYRTSGETKMNAKSSRSHSIFTMKIHQKDAEDESRSVFARLNLVDLAGSERASKTEATGSRLKEGANINKSLMALGSVINALAEKANAAKGKKRKVFIPYRNSKLTRVLQESLGGNSLCSMLATLSPARSNLEETLSTIQYANRAKMIQVAATKNEEMTQIDSLNDEIAALKKKLAEAASGGGSTSGMSEGAKKKIQLQYEKQISEMQNMVSQTWDDRAALSKKHEEERTALTQQREKEQKEMKLKFEKERKKRWNLLEEKGDVEGILRELISGNDGNTANEPNQTKQQQKQPKDTTNTPVKSGLIVQEVETWCADFREAKKSETAMNEQRMVLQVYRDSFETDMKAMNGEAPLKMTKSIGGNMMRSPGSPRNDHALSPSKENNNGTNMLTAPMHPMSPSNSAGVGGGLPPHRMKVILEQAHGKIGTLKNEGAVWIKHSEKLFQVCKQLATRIAQKLNKAPPGEAPDTTATATKSGIEPPTEPATTSSTESSPSPKEPSQPFSQPPFSPKASSIADAPIGQTPDEVSRTKEYLSKYLQGPKPPLSSKLLSRPPYRYLHDLIMALRMETGFTEGLFNEDELHSAKSTPRNIKISFLQKLIAYTSLLTNRRVDIFSDPEQIVAGLECNKTNRMLQCVVEAVTMGYTRMDASNTKRQKRGKELIDVTTVFLKYATKALNGDKPTPLQFDSAQVNGDNNASANGPGNQNGGTDGGGGGGGGGGGASTNNNGHMTTGSLSTGVPVQLNANDVAGLELVLRLLRTKYLSDVARLESKRDRASLFSCGSAAAKLARVLRLEARKCLDESMTGGDATGGAATNNNNKEGDTEEEEGSGSSSSGGSGGSQEADDKMILTARALENHASIVEPQVPNAPSNKSPEQMRQAASSSSLERLSKIMAALVVLRSCVSDRIARTRDAERQARSTSDAKLVSLTSKYSEMQKTSQLQLEKIKKMEVNIVSLQESEKRLQEHVSSLETQREADREAASTLREKIAETAAADNQLNNAEAAKELSAEKLKVVELEEKIRQTNDDYVRIQEESKSNIEELQKVRLLHTDVETQLSAMQIKLVEEESKTANGLVETNELKTRLSELEEELETAGMEGARSDELTQQVLALKAQHELFESRTTVLQDQVDEKKRTIEELNEKLADAETMGTKLKDAEEEFHMAVEILTEERDAARQKEEEYFEELQSTSEDLAGIQTGYVTLSDRLNDKTDQIFEVQELLDDEKATCLDLRQQLLTVQQELMQATKELLALQTKQKENEVRTNNTTHRTTPTKPTPSATLGSSPAAATATSAATASPATNATASSASTSVSPSAHAQLEQESAQKDQLIRSLQQQLEDVRNQAALAPAEQVLVDAASTNAEESVRQLEEATEMIESLRSDLEEAKAETKEFKKNLNRALRERDRAVDETNRDADQRVKRAIDDAKKAQNAVFEQRQEMSRMEDELQQAQKAQAIAEAAFAAVDATEIGEEDIMGSSRGGRNNDYARGSAASAARVMRKNTNASLDDSYGADEFSDDNYGSDFD